MRGIVRLLTGQQWAEPRDLWSSFVSSDRFGSASAGLAFADLRLDCRSAKMSMFVTMVGRLPSTVRDKLERLHAE